VTSVYELGRGGDRLAQGPLEFELSEFEIGKGGACPWRLQGFKAFSLERGSRYVR
jgi:hypothetical protein